MRLRALVLPLLLLGLTSGLAAAQDRTAQDRTAQDRTAQDRTATTWDQALDLSRQHGKPILIDFFTEW